MCSCTGADPLRVKKDITITNELQNILDESGRKPSKTWVDKGSDFYNRSTKSWLQDNKKINDIVFRMEKVIRQKSSRLPVKWKGYNISFNSWINKKYIL